MQLAVEVSSETQQSLRVEHFFLEQRCVFMYAQVTRSANQEQPVVVHDQFVELVRPGWQAGCHTGSILGSNHSLQLLHQHVDVKN